MRNIIFAVSLVLFVSNVSPADVLVCDFENDAVLRFDNDGNYIDEFIPSGTAMLASPRRLALGPTAPRSKLNS